jgi:hypothetical protein
MQIPRMKVAMALAAVVSVAAPGIAQARPGSGDPPAHVRGEHHRIAAPRHDRNASRLHARRSDDNRPEVHGADDGPNHT